MLRPATAVTLLALLLVAAGCGSSQEAVDKGGFSDRNRANARAALETLRGTAIPGTIVQLTGTIGLPLVCRVHLDANDSKTFDLLMAWKPLPRTDSAYTWFKARIGPNGADPASLHLGVSRSFGELRSNYGVGYTKPFDPCRIDAFGNVDVVPWTGAYPPSGKVRVLPSD